MIQALKDILQAIKKKQLFVKAIKILRFTAVTCGTIFKLILKVANKHQTA